MAALSDIANITSEMAIFVLAVAALVVSGTIYIRSNGRYRYDHVPALRPVMVKSRPGRR